MSDQQPKPEKALSEISHLFLSSVRDRQTNGGAARPKRTPPSQQAQQPAQQQPAHQQPSDPAPSSGNGAHCVELTPEELAHVFDDIDAHHAPSAAAAAGSHPDAERMPPVSAVIAQHLNGHQHDRAREYAAHLCKSGERVGLIEVDACEFRLTCFERGGNGDAPRACAIPDETLDPRRMAEALEELNWDVDRWLLLLPTLRGYEARAVLRLIDRWTVLATCDHDGVVSCYRTLKGLSDLHQAETEQAPDWPTLSLALLGAHDELTAMRVFRKLSGVCQQFLHWPLESEAPVQAAGSFVETPVFACRATRDKAQLAAAPQWQVVINFLTRCKAGAVARDSAGGSAGGGGAPTPRNPIAAAHATVKLSRPVAEPTLTRDTLQYPAGMHHATAPATPNTTEAPASLRLAAPAVESHRQPAADTAAPLAEGAEAEVIDLPAGTDTSAAIVAATLRGGGDLVECPVKPPMLADASLAVARDRRLVLLAVARQGLSDLRAIGEAFRWMNENRALIAMAVPQLSIDPHQLPHLRLLVDRADLSAATLQPLLQSGNVTVHTYRKLRWGAKTGLLLEAA